MLHYAVIAIDPTHKTLCESEQGDKFTAKSKEYVIVALDDEYRQVGVPDYGYINRRKTQALADRLNRRERQSAAPV